MIATAAMVLIALPLSLPSWSVAVDPYGGAGVMVSRGLAESIPLGGAQLRLRVRSLQLGGYAEAGMLTEDLVQAFGAVGGVFLPVRKWLEIDLAVGYGARAYQNRTERLSLGDYRVSLPVGTLWAGVSDRTGALIGLRLGAHLVAALDLDREHRAWRIAPTDHSSGSSGVRHFGGTSLAVVLSIGGDVTVR